MEVVQVLHMNGGSGDTSYAQNSLVQQKVISMTKPITEEAMTDFYYSSFPKSLAIADLGCSSGLNTLFAVSLLIKTVEKICRQLGHKSPEYQVFLNDLPGNDFNTIFKSLAGFQKNMENQIKDGIGPCFFTGVPGSFYGRLFLSNSLDFIHSSYSLQWLSKVPDGVEDNKGNIYMASGSPPSVLKAYYAQFRKDFSTFLKCRSEELTIGGRMVLTFLGRRSEDPASKECCYIWELLATVLNELVQEGLIEKEKFDLFNIPQYTPSPFEVKKEIEMNESFTINCLEVSEVDWNAYQNEYNISDAFKDGGYNVAMCMRAVAEPLLIGHFGFDKNMIEEIFYRYKLIVSNCMVKEKTKFVNVIVSMTKIA